VRLCSG